MKPLTLIAATHGNNLELARTLAGIAGSLQARTRIILLPDCDLPLYTPERESESVPEAAKTLRDQLLDSRATIWVAPEYNGSIPPMVSNAIAWVSRTGGDWRAAFNGRFAVVATHSGGPGKELLWAMRTQLQHLGVLVLPRTISVGRNRPLKTDSARAEIGQLLALTG